MVNFAECPENLHFETALARAAAAKGVRLDVLHDFEYHYDFLGGADLRGGSRVKYSGVKQSLGMAGAADAVLLLDFPKRARCAAAFMKLLLGPGPSAVHFIANHLIPMPGQNTAADLARRCRALKEVKSGYILESDDAALWAEAGLPGGRLFRRGYSSDCEYYRPLAGPKGGYVFSAGSAGRDFGVLASAAARSGLPLLVFTDSQPGRLPGRATVLPLARNLHRLREAAGNASAVAITVADDCRNEAAGNSIAFLSMAMGRPVVIRRTRYMERFIEDGINGFFYSRLTPGAVGAAIRRAASLKPAAARRLAAAARRTILAKASLDRFCSSLVKNI